MTSVKLKKRGLGRGLSALLGESSEFYFGSSDLGEPSHSANLKQEKILKVPLTKLKAGKYQPRQQFLPESLQELAESIREQGIIQPIIARKIAGSSYEIIAGERRFRAAQLAGLSEAPVIIREVSDKNVAAISLIENIQRENLNPIEEAQALKRLQDEFHLTQSQMGEAIGKSRVSVTHLLRLLDLNPVVQKFLQNGKLDKGHAKVLLALPVAHQAKAAERIVTKSLSVRDTEKLVSKLVNNHHYAQTSASVKSASDPNISALERKLSDQLGTPVMITHNHKNSRGKLVIYYHHLDSLDRILNKLQS